MDLECCKVGGILLLVIVISISSLPASAVPRVVKVICTDNEGRALCEALVLVYDLKGELVFEGVTKENGSVVMKLNEGNYTIRVIWLNTLVGSKDIYVSKYSLTVPINCSVYHLKVIVNFLYLIPSRNVDVVVKNASSGHLVKVVSKPLEVPYRFYSLSAEAIIRLPKGKYEVVVRGINLQTKHIVLRKSTTVLFTQVYSIESIIIFILLVATVITCLGFILLGRLRIRRLKER
ncbi:MAG: hypothetical protein DRJ49_05915 [Thermoprotei archaeon]|nr:MAG: hypothetical protein DRJ49_05915 [Thermoprotei archaeon]